MKKTNEYMVEVPIVEELEEVAEYLIKLSYHVQFSSDDEKFSHSNYIEWLLLKNILRLKRNKDYPFEESVDPVL